MKTKELLKEWKTFLNRSLLVEGKFEDAYKELSSLGKVTKEEWNKYINHSDPNIRNKLKNDIIFLRIVYNTLKIGKHSIDDVIALFNDYVIYVSSQYNSGHNLYVDVPGDIRLDLKAHLDNNTASYDELSSYISGKKELKLNSKKLKNSLNISDYSEGSATDHFDIIVNESSSDWIICYPKTMLGSISLSRSYFSNNRLNYDTTFNVSANFGTYAGSMAWCTAKDSENNMFYNYHRQENKHMYYCISKHDNTVRHMNNKICVSFDKKNNNVTLHEGIATVDSKNNKLSEEEVKELLGNAYSILEDDVKKEERKEIDSVKFYESISLSQYEEMRKANVDYEEFFASEVRKILYYSKDKNKILEKVILDYNTDIFMTAMLSSSCPLGLKIESLNRIASDVKNITKDESDEKRYFYDVAEVTAEILRDPKLDSLDNESIKIINKILQILNEKEAVSTNYFIREVFDHVKTRDVSKKAFYLILNSNDSKLTYDFSSLTSYNRNVLLGQTNLPDEIAQKIYTASLNSLMYRKYFVPFIGYYEKIIFNEKFPVELLEIIADSEIEKVRILCASNDRTPRNVLKKLAWDKKVEVSNRASATLKDHFEESLKKPFKEDDLVELSRNTSVRIRTKIAKSDLSLYDNDIVKTVVVNLVNPINNRNYHKVNSALASRSDLETLGIPKEHIQKIYSLASDDEKDKMKKSYFFLETTTENLIAQYINLIID